MANETSNNPVINTDLLSFWTELNYACQGNSKNVASHLSDYDISYYHAKNITRRIQENGHQLANDVAMAWDTFFRAIPSYNAEELEQKYIALRDKIDPALHQNISTFFEHPEQNCFLATDLQVVPDNSENLRPNQIPQSQYRALVNLYNQFMDRVEFKENLTFKEYTNLSAQVAWTIQMLMSRELGARLIQRIVEKLPAGKKIIFDLQSDHYNFHEVDAQGNPTIGFKVSDSNLAENITMNHVPNKGLTSLRTSNYIAFGHELTHLLHFLEGISHNPNDQNFGQFYTSVDEQFTITGNCLCHYPQNPYPFSENSLLNAFRQFPREYHISGLPAEASPCYAFIHALLSKAQGDSERRPPPPRDKVRALFKHMLAVNGPGPIDYARELRKKGIFPSLDTPESAHGNQSHSLSNSLQVNLFGDPHEDSAANSLLNTDVAMPPVDDWADVEMTHVDEPEDGFEEDEGPLGLFSITDLQLYPENALGIPENGIRPSELQQALDAYNHFIDHLECSVDQNQYPRLKTKAFLKQVCDLFLHVLSRAEGRALFNELLPYLDDQNIHIRASDATNTLCSGGTLQLNIDWSNFVSALPLPFSLSDQSEVVQIALNDLLGFLENQN
jgi:hypothetical protein